MATPEASCPVTMLKPDGWWAAVEQGRLLLLRCAACRAAWVPWTPNCPNCGPGSSVQVAESGGRGTLYSWVVVHRSASHPDETPYAVASVLTDEGAMVYGRLLLPDGEQPVANGAVQAEYPTLIGRKQVAFRQIAQR